MYTERTNRILSLLNTDILENYFREHMPDYKRLGVLSQDASPSEEWLLCVASDEEIEEMFDLFLEAEYRDMEGIEIW